MTLFPLRNGHHSTTLVCVIISVWKGRSGAIPSKREYLSHFCNENIFTFELVQMFGAATNTNKFFITTGGPALVSGGHVTGGLVAARSLAAASRPVGRPRLGRWTARPVVLSTLWALFFLTLHQVSSLHQVSATCTHAHDAGALNGF